MSIRNMFFSAAFGIASLTAAHAEGLRPIEGKSIDLGGISGIAYYTVERNGFHVVTTLAQGESGTPIRVVSVLAPGQRVVLSTRNKRMQSRSAGKATAFSFARQTRQRTDFDSNQCGS
jgi:hypothetical protein